MKKARSPQSPLNQRSQSQKRTHRRTLHTPNTPTKALRGTLSITHFLRSPRPTQWPSATVASTKSPSAFFSSAPLSRVSQAFPKTHRQAGFGILEVILSIFIITLVLAGFGTVLSLSMQGQREREDSAVAAEIAREGIEWIIAKRNNNLECIETSCGTITDWRANLIGVWEVDTTETAQLEVGNSLDPFVSGHYLCFKGEGRSGYGSASSCEAMLPQDYTRKIVIDAIDDHRIRVQAVVEWGRSPAREELIQQIVLFE